ncbi:MAG TPA: YvcK family protein [Dehalococcoidia bacterium]|nr:YvcK family protein [Dehalococcoidia bacterium]HIK98930.1 YvcK family protein [Dehalococcoidia bacterium]
MKPSVVVIGGGTGNFSVLSGLKDHEIDLDLTAVVAMSDSGGSSGRLRDELGQLPPGDIRQCLVALAGDAEQGAMLRQLFTHRFSMGEGLEGHSVGNLLLAALTEITGAHDRAIEAASRILNIRGRVLPVTLTDTHLHAVLSDGRELEEEALIDTRGNEDGAEIDHVFLSPLAYAFPPVLESIAHADLIVLSPGDLYTSLIPNLLAQGVGEAIRSTRARLVYVTNLMTKPGETDGFTAERFVSEVNRYIGHNSRIDVVLVNSTEFSERVQQRYLQLGARIVEYDLSRMKALVPWVVENDLVAEGIFVRHDPDKLANAVMSLLPKIVQNESSGGSPAAGD